MESNIKKIKRTRELIKILNQASDAYYNTGNPIMTDFQYDQLFNELFLLEKETGLVMSGSLTQKVGAASLDYINKKKHDHPMLSLDKCHSVEEIINFSGQKEIVMMAKMDGLTVTIRYENGQLVSAETRGDGIEGKDVTEHVKQFDNVPLTIPQMGTVVVDGEAIIRTDDFVTMTNEMPQQERYKNSRNLASGTLNLLDTSLVKKRKMKFIAWDFIKGDEQEGSFFNRLVDLERIGFETVPYRWVRTNAEDTIQKDIEQIVSESEIRHFQIDGTVIKFDDVAYGESLGRTERFFRNAIAYKFYDERELTKLIDVTWGLGKSGALTPIAVFEPIQINGTTIEKASLHNLTIFKNLELSKGDTISVYKANQIIPQVYENLTKTRENLIEIPEKCPYCSQPLRVIKENKTEILTCTNDICRGKLLKRLTQYCKEDGMNIKGLSEQTLQLLISYGYVIDIADLYHLNERKAELSALPGMGARSVQKLLDEIETSRKTDLHHFLTALSIPNVGAKTAKIIENFFVKRFKDRYESEGNDVLSFFIRMVFSYDWSEQEGIGLVIDCSLKQFFMENKGWIQDLGKELDFEIDGLKEDGEGEFSLLKGKIFVITGSVVHFKNRNEMKKLIESKGGNVTGSVSRKTDYLINNDSQSGSVKNEKAKELGIPVITEEDFLEMVKE